MPRPARWPSCTPAPAIPRPPTESRPRLCRMLGMPAPGHSRDHMTDSVRVGADGVADLHGRPYATGPGAVSTAEEPTLDLHAMADDPAAAVLADRRQPLDRALERVERMDLPSCVDVKRHPVLVPAYLARCHTHSLCRSSEHGNRTRKPARPVAREGGPRGPLAAGPAGLGRSLAAHGSRAGRRRGGRDLAYQDLDIVQQCGRLLVEVKDVAAGRAGARSAVPLGRFDLGGDARTCAATRAVW